MYFENIRPEDIFRHRMNGRGILIDLRAEQDYVVGHIPGAINIPYEQLQQHISELRKMIVQRSQRNGSAVLIVYCDRGNTSLRASKDLYSAGFRVKNVYGGMAKYRGPITHS